jgi:hypothetical protein
MTLRFRGDRLDPHQGLALIGLIKINESHCRRHTIFFQVNLKGVFVMAEAATRLTAVS